MFRLILGLVALPLLLCEFAVLRHQPFSAWALVNIAVYPLVTLSSIALHETGHALAARAVGLQVRRLQVGIGRTIARWRWAETTFSLHALPVMGLTYIVGPHANGLKWRYWVSIAAGPAVTLAIIAGVLAWCGPLEVDDIVFPSAAAASRFAAVELLGFANLWMLVLNLAPLPRLGSHGIARNDGSQLLIVPFQSAKTLEILQVGPALLDAQDLIERDDHEGARRILEAALGRFPGSWAVINSLAIVQLNLNRLADARTLFLGLLETDPPSPEMRWIARNNLAWVDYRLRVHELREEADQHSDAVLMRFKNAAWAMGTRGAVLSWLGRHDEAIRLLEGAYLRNSLPSNRALNAAGLAMALATLGRTREASQWLERARSNHAACPLVAEAQAALSAATTDLAAAPRE